MPNRKAYWAIAILLLVFIAFVVFRRVDQEAHPLAEFDQASWSDIGSNIEISEIDTRIAMRLRDSHLPIGITTEAELQSGIKINMLDHTTVWLFLCNEGLTSKLYAVTIPQGGDPNAIPMTCPPTPTPAPTATATETGTPTPLPTAAPLSVFVPTAD